MQETLSKKFKVSGIPTLMFLNGANGQLITSDGRSIVMEDPEGKDFPWTPKPVVELLSGKVQIKTGETTWAEMKENVDVIGIYFSAHWVNHKIVIMYSTAQIVHVHLGVLCCFALFVCLILLASFFLLISHLKTCTCIYSVWCLVSLVVSLPRPSPSY